MGMFWPDPPDPRIRGERINRITLALMHMRALGDAFAALAELCPQNAVLKMGAANKVAKMKSSSPLSGIIRQVEADVWPDIPDGRYRDYREALEYLANMADASTAAETKEWAMALQTSLLRKSLSIRAVVEVLSAEVDHTISVLEQELRKLGVE